METTVVPVKSAFASGINWIQVIGIIAGIATYFGVAIPPDLAPAIAAAIPVVMGVVTIIRRTWFTKSVIEQSVK